MRRFWLGLGIVLISIGQLAPGGRAQEGVVEPIPQPRVEVKLPEALERKIDQITTEVAPKPSRGRLPSDLSGGLFQGTSEAPYVAPVYSYLYWQAPEIWHRPLYLDDQQLERYGQTPAPHLQPVLSGAHFLASSALLPYKMMVDHPHARMTNLGYYRVGSPMPCVGRRIPLELDAAAVQAAFITAIILAVP